MIDIYHWRSLGGLDSEKFNPVRDSDEFEISDKSDRIDKIHNSETLEDSGDSQDRRSSE